MDVDWDKDKNGNGDKDKDDINLLVSRLSLEPCMLILHLNLILWFPG